MPVSSDLTAREAVNAGTLLFLTDNQVKLMKDSLTNKLFDYRIKFDLNADFEAKLINTLSGYSE